jgi:hypothetical protein
MSTSDLRELIGSYSTPLLLEQYVHEKEHYTADAYAIIESEINHRGITPKDVEAYKNQSLVDENRENSNVQVVHFKRDDFVKIEGLFLKNDNVLLRSILADAQIPYFFDSTVELKDKEMPDDKERFSTYVHKDSLEKAQPIIDTHFICDNGFYSQSVTDIKERLKTFSFQDIQQSAIGATENVDVSFSHEEKAVLLTYGHRLLHEIDRIESSQERIVFFYDHLEDLCENLDSEDTELSVTDLFTSLEILQIYCDESDFPKEGLGIAEALLGFFLQ